MRIKSSSPILSAVSVLALAPSPALAQEIASACERPRADAASTRLKPASLDSLVALSAQGRSDALIVLEDGRVVGEWYFGRQPGPIQTMSMTKSVVGLLVGHLLSTGHLDSLDQQVADFYPEWRQGRKADVTIRMLLNHTSGLQNVPNAGAEIYPAPDAVQLALAAELAAEPGTEWSYNNKAVNLFAGIVEKATGLPLDEAVYRKILAPLCIERADWYKDESGTPHAMAGLELAPMDLAKLGQLMLQKGRWGNRQIVSADWVERSILPSQEQVPRSGLLWWLMANPGDSLSANAGLEDVRGFYAEGYLGNYLVVLPHERVVVVRMKRNADDFEQAHAMRGFPDVVARLLSRDHVD